MNQLSIENLNLQYKNGVKAIDDISLTIRNGMFGLLGPNGAGKSSLMKTIVGLQQPQSGKLLYNGTDIIRQPEFIRKQLGFLPQDFGVYPRTSAVQLLQHLAVLKGVADAKERKKQIDILLEKVNLTAEKNKEVFRFSGGMRQRFGIAQALLGNPSIIIVDEPTAGLDPEERNRFNGILSEISREVIVLLSTHLVEDVRNLCSSMAILKNGRIRGVGNPGELVSTLQGKIWAKIISKNELADVEQRFNVISHHWVENQQVIAVYATQQPEGFEAVIPTLEHFYFYTIKQAAA
jgi:ABC-type multidrug transport system ATPase subunit